MKATSFSSSISANFGNSGEAMVEIHKYSVKQCHYKKYSHFKGRDTAKIPGRHTHAILSRDRTEDDENIFVQRCQSIYVYNLCSHTGLHTNTHTHTHSHRHAHKQTHTLAISIPLTYKYNTTNTHNYEVYTYEDTSAMQCICGEWERSN